MAKLAGAKPRDSNYGYRDSVLLHSIIICTISKHRGVHVSSMNKTRSRRKLFITSTSASAASRGSRCSASSQHLFKPLF
jgi:hypothetical protein